MERKAVRSTNVASVGYDPKSKVLEIEFKSGGVYQYANVPEKRYQIGNAEPWRADGRMVLPKLPHVRIMLACMPCAGIGFT